MLKGQQMNNMVNAKNLEDFLGKEVGLTDWVEIDQDRINKFAEATGDFQYIHVDKDRAAKLLLEQQSSHLHLFELFHSQTQ